MTIIFIHDDTNLSFLRIGPPGIYFAQGNYFK